MFLRQDVLINLAKLTGKHLCQSLFFNKVADLRPATLLKKRLWHRCFPVNFVKFLRTPFLTEHTLWLLLSTTYLSVHLAESSNHPQWVSLSPLKNLFLVLTPENVWKFDIFPGESSSPHQGNETVYFKARKTGSDFNTFTYILLLLKCYSPPATEFSWEALQFLRWSICINYFDNLLPYGFKT